MDFIFGIRASFHNPHGHINTRLKFFPICIFIRWKQQISELSKQKHIRDHSSPWLWEWPHYSFKVWPGSKRTQATLFFNVRRHIIIISAPIPRLGTQKWQRISRGNHVTITTKWFSKTIRKIEAVTNYDKLNDASVWILNTTNVCTSVLEYHKIYIMLPQYHFYYHLSSSQKHTEPWKFFIFIRISNDDK